MGFLLWITFFSAPGAVEVTTLGVTALSLIWFATVEPHRLVEDSGRPQLMLFGLATVALALLVTAATFLSSATTFLILLIGIAAIVTGLIRAIRYGMTDPGPEG